MLKKVFIVLVLISLLFLRTISPAVWADTPTPTLTDTITPTPTTDPNASSTQPTPTPTGTQQNANLNSATPMPTPTTNPIATPTITPTPTNSITATNSAAVTNNTNSNGNSGGNTITASGSADLNATDSANLEATPSADTTSQNNTNGGSTGNKASINTGTAVAVTQADNNVNTTSVNSQYVNQTINIFATQTQNLDLTVPFAIANQLITKDNNTSPQINIQVNADNSYTVVTNNIVNTANSGANNITDSDTGTNSGQLIINTGNAYSVVALTNKVNFTIVDSVIHVITINIFGTLNGNIILPDTSHASICNGCGLSANINNQATVTNNVTSSATSGENTINKIGSGSATIISGDSISIINLDNIINTNVIGVPFEHLFINTFGFWNGKFLGWGGFGPQPGNQNYAFNGVFPNGDGTNTNCPNCANSVNVNNQAKVTNNITSSANTGKNTITGDASIQTGTAYSAVSLLNFVNATFIRTFGFFGFINIFGNWNGDIGNTQAFITPTPTPTTDTSSSTNNTNSSSSCTTNGAPQVATDISDNVGAYVNPGDTVLFYVHVKNTGQNDLNKENVKIALTQGNTFIGGASIDINRNITPGKSELVTAGLSLAKVVPGGIYTATAIVTGNTCDSKSAQANASTTFQVSGAVLGVGIEKAEAATAPKAVLGTTTKIASVCSNCIWWPLLIIELGFLLIYTFIEKKTKKKNVMVMISIPVLTYLLFLLVNKGCGFNHSIFIQASSFWCKYFIIFDILLALLYILVWKKGLKMYKMSNKNKKASKKKK